MKIKIKHHILFIFILLVCLLFSACQSNQLAFTEDFTLENDAFVMLHFSTLTDTKLEATPSPESHFYTYNAEGTLIKQSLYRDEIVRDILIETSNGLNYFMKNHTLLTGGDSLKSLSGDPDYTINQIRFGPSQTGYIKSTDTSYCLLNYGQKPNQPYINIVRFVRDSDSYEVIVPYYLENITYDQASDQFYLIISSLNEGVTDGHLAYSRLSFNTDSNRYQLEDSISTVTYDGLHNHPEFSFLFRHTFASNQVLYSAYVGYPESYLNDTDPNKFASEGVLYLSTYDEKTHGVTHQILQDTYSLNGYGVLAGSADLPMSVQTDQMHVFTTNNKVYTIGYDGRVITSDMRYPFEKALNLRTPRTSKVYQSEDFFNTVVSVESNDEIYIMVLFKKGLVLYQLVNGDYTEVWSGPLPDGLRDDMFLNTFELIGNEG